MPKIAIIPSILILAAALCSHASASSGSAAAVSTATTPVSIQAGEKQQFQIASGNSAATWYVNDVTGGNTLVGKVTSSGLYTAPSTAPDTDIALTVVDSLSRRTTLVAQIEVVDNPAILEAHQRWIDGAIEAAAVYGCLHPTIQQDKTESVADALKVYVLTATQSSCLILSPVSSDPELSRYSYAWGGNVDGVDIYYISDVSRPRILMGNPVAGE